MSDEEDAPEVEYIADEGFVRLNLRRPVNLYVPSELQESYVPDAKSAKPSSVLQLEWVYGYRGRDCRNNLIPLASGEIVYFAASVAVIYNPETNTQRHFFAHTDDIKCIAVHPDGKTIATGQIKGREGNFPHVCVWDSESLEILHVLGEDVFDRGVNCVAFSKEDGDLLAAVDDAPEQRLSVWRWAEEKKEAEAKASADPVIAVTFSGESPSRIVTSGKNHLGFWSFDGGDLNKKSGIFGSYEKPKYVTTVATLPSGDVITGDSNGNILVWKEGGNTVEKCINGAHEGSVFYLDVSEDGTVMSTGKDRKVVVYNSQLEPTGESIKIQDELGAPRVVFKLGDDLFLGTTNNSILKTTFENDPTIITQGHLEELWGLGAHHTEPHFVTAGHDGKVYYRNATSHETIWSKSLEMSCQSADIVPVCNHVTVVGGASGKWVAIDNETQEILHEGCDGDEPIQVTRFSPDGSKIALGSRDNTVYIYDFNEDGKSFTERGKCEGHSSFVTHLDWSSDGELLRTNSGDYEVLFWKTEDCSHITQSEDFKDVEWATNNCILAFNSIGIWPPGTDGTHINSCNKANEKPLIVTGDDFGMVKIFAYPSIVHDAKHHAYHGHSSHVTNVVFLPNDTHVLSTGGRDTATLQWKVWKKRSSEKRV